jgi:hypothetical protein
MSELTAGRDRPGGRRASIPKEHRNPHFSAATVQDRPLPFGEPPKRRSRITAAIRQVRETVISLGLVDYELHEPPEIAPEDLVASDLPEESAPEGIVRRKLGWHVAHFSHPFNDPRRVLVGYSTYPHEVEVDTNKTVRPKGPNDEGKLILNPSFNASLLAEDIGRIPTLPNFWYAKSGTQTVRYNPERQVLYLK